MIAVGFSSTMRFHQRNVSPLATPPGLPPSVPRPAFCVGSLMSLIIKKRRFPARKEYRSHVPSIANGRLVASTWENSVCSPVGSTHLRHHQAWFVEAAAVMIPRQIIDLFAAVLLQHPELPHDLFAFRILRQAYF